MHVVNQPVHPSADVKATSTQCCSNIPSTLLDNIIHFQWWSPDIYVGNINGFFASDGVNAHRECASMFNQSITTLSHYVNSLQPANIANIPGSFVRQSSYLVNYLQMWWCKYMVLIERIYITKNNVTSFIILNEKKNNNNVIKFYKTL